MEDSNKATQELLKDIKYSMNVITVLLFINTAILFLAGYIGFRILTHSTLSPLG